MHDSIVARLRAAGCVFAEEEADLLVSESTTPDELEARVRRRVAGEPLEQIVGWVEFCGLRIAVAPGVFVPRRRSGLIVEEAAAFLDPRMTVAEVCCGVGAIAAVLATRHPGVEIIACDLDPAAVSVARRNLHGIGEVFEGDLLDALPERLRGRLDLIVANAPYVPTADIRLMPPEARLHEAGMALDGGPDGLDVQRRLIAAAPEWMSALGHLVIETSRRQSAATAALAEHAGLESRIVYSDSLEGTVVVASMPVG